MKEIKLNTKLINISGFGKTVYIKNPSYYSGSVNHVLKDGDYEDPWQ